MKSHSKRILSLVFALLMLFQQVMFAAQTVDLFNPELGAKTVDLIPGEDDTNTVDLLTPSEEDSTKTVDLLNPEQPSATIEQQKPIIEKNENKTVDIITPRGDDIVPAEGKKSTTTIVVGGDEIEEGETNENSEISPEEIILPEENEKEEKKDASFEDEEHHENAGVLPWSTDLVKPWSIYRAPKTVYRPGEDLDLTELLVEIKTGRSGSLYNIEDLINDEFTTITRTRKSDGQKVRLDDKIYEDETMTIHMDGCQDLTIDFTVDENLKDEAKAFEAFQQNLIREEFRNGLDFSLYLIKKGEKENPVVAYSLDPHKLTPIGNGVDKKLKDGPLFDLKDINSWDRYDIETIGKVKAILERSAELKDTENIRKKLITQLAIWNVTSNIIPEEIDATVSEPTEIAPELKPADETKENPEEDKKDEPIEITEPTTPEEETENIEKENEKVEDTKDETVEIKTEEKVEEKAETEENKESEKIEEKAPVQSTVHKIVFNAKEIDVPYDDIELSDEEYELYKELTSLEAVELKNEDEDLKIYEPIIIEETENQYADLVTIGESDIDSIERVATEVTFDAVEYSFQNLYHTLETSSMLGFGQPRDFNVLLKATMKASRKIVEGDKFEVEILSKTLPILNGEEGRANDIQIDGKVVATAEYIAEEHKIVYTFVEDLDTDKVEIEQEFKQIKEEKAALLNMLEVSENLVLDAVRGAEGDENSEENPDELEISPEDDNAAIKLVLGNTPVQYNGYSFETKKFRLKTTMTAKAAPVWQIPVDWTFDVNIGPYLKPDPKNPLKSLYDPNNPSVEVARPKYDPDKHVIKYTFIKPLNNTKTFNIDQLLAFDTDKIANREEIEINIVIAPKNYKVQKMPTIKVRKDDPRSEIISQFVVENKQDLYKVVYPYMVSYVSRQSVNNRIVTWDIDVDTSTLKREGLDYNNIALSLYIPNKQGLSDYKVYVDGTEGAFDTSGDLVLFNKTIAKDTIPDNLKIKVQAQTSVERDAYSLGIRITPDIGYIKKLREELKQRIKDKNSILGPLLTLIEFIEDPNNSTQFDDGFNLLDTRITAIAPPENGRERAVGYNDPLRSVYFNNAETRKFDIRISETLDLKNLKDIKLSKDKKYIENIGNDVFAVNATSVELLSVANYNQPVVNIYVPKNDGTYEKIDLKREGNTQKVTKNNFNNAIKKLYDEKRLLPGTIIEYEYSGTYDSVQKYLSMKLNLNEREVYNDQLLKYTTAGGFAEAKLINIGNKQDTYRVGKYVFKDENAENSKQVLFKIIETGENGYCINLGTPNPTNFSNYHKKIIVEEGVGLDVLYKVLDKNKPNLPKFKNRSDLLMRLKKIFFYYDKYEREHNLDIITDEDTKYQIRNARQAAIFDAVSNNGKDFLDQGTNNGGAVADSVTRKYYNELNDIIKNSPDLTAEQFKSVTITLYPVADTQDIQNIITGEVENPVYLEKVGQDGEPLFGAEFVIIQNGIEVKRWISDGMAKELYLEPGEYILRETKAPDGYKQIDDIAFLVDKIITVNDITISRLQYPNDKYYSSQERYTNNVIKIDSNDKLSISSDGHKLKVINKKNSFKLKKVDGTDESKLLKNAEFALYKIIDSGNSTTREELVETRTTNESGEIEFAGLDTGSYILKENMAPEGYKKIDEELYFDVQKNGEIRFGNVNENGISEKNYFKVIQREPIPKQVKYTELKSTKEHLTIEYHERFKDYLNMETKVISQDINTVKSRIILNPSTDNTNGNGPDQPTYLTLNKNTAKTLKYKVYKVSASNKGSISNAQINAIESYPEVDVTEASKEIFFDTTSTRWNGDAYVVDITAFYDEMNTGTTAERNISYKWGNKPTPTVQENYLAGELGVNVECYEKTVLVPTPPIVKVKNYKTYDFKIEKVDSKVDENGNLKHLQYAEFKLYDEENKVVKEAFTDANGIAEFKDIKIGKYILKETKAPEGYNKIQKPIYVNISEDGKITFSNYQDKIELDSTIFVPKKEKDTTKKVVKFDDIKDRVEELKIREHSVYPDFMNLKTNLISADQNTVKTRIFLNPSTDTIKGKGPNRNTVLTLLKNNANSVDYKVYKIFNNEKWSITEENILKKTPFATGSIGSNNTEANIDFKTYGTYSTPDATDEERWHGDAYIVDIISHYNDKIDTSDEKREISFDWKYINSQGSVGDHLNGEVGATVKFKEEDVVVKEGEPILQVKNSKGTNFKILKVDANDENIHLKDAEFTLLNKETKEVKKVTTDENGIAEFKELKPGKYVLQETSAPGGYTKINRAIDVNIDNDGKISFGRETNDKVFALITGTDIITLKVVNVKRSKVTIVKVDEDDKTKLDGAIFGLYEKDGKTSITRDNKPYTVTTETDGKATFEGLEPGKTYIIQEIEAPKGYEKTNKTWKVVVGEDNKVQVFERIPKKPKELFKITNPTNALTYSYQGTQIFRVFPTIISNNDGSYTAKVDLRGLLDQSDDYRLSLIFDTDNFEFDNQTISKINGLWEKRFPLNAPKQTLEFKFRIKDNAKSVDYYPIKNIYYNAIVPTAPVEFPKMQLIGNGGGEKTTEYEIVKQNNMRIFQDNNRNNMCAFGSVIAPIENSNSYMLYVYFDSLYNRDTNAYMFIRLNTKLFDVENIDDYNNFFSGQLNWTFNTNKVIGREFLKFKITPKSNLAVDKLQPIVSFTFNQRDIFEKDNNGLYLSYLKKKSTNNNDNDPEPNPPAPNPEPNPPAPNPEPTPGNTDFEEVRIESIPNCDEFTFTVTNKQKLYEVEFDKISSNKDENGQPIPLSGAQFKLMKKEKIDGSEKFVEYKTETQIESDKNGKISIKGLKFGEYKLFETKAPDGYEIVPVAVKHFEITKDGDVFVYNNGKKEKLDENSKKIVNHPKEKGKITIYKTDNNGNPLKNAVFELQGKEIKYQNVQKNDGTISFTNLEPGIYILKEIKAPDGYNITDRTWTVTVYSTGDTSIKENPFNADEEKSSNRDVSKLFDVEEYSFHRLGDESKKEKYIYPNCSQFFEIEYTLKSKQDKLDIKEGDYFETQYSKYICRPGTIVGYEPENIYLNGELLAVATYKERTDAEQGDIVRYTFTKYVEGFTKDLEIQISEALNVNREVIPNTTTVDFVNNICGIEKKDKGYNINYQIYQLRRNDVPADSFYDYKQITDGKIGMSSFINTINYINGKVTLLSYIDSRNIDPRNYKIRLFVNEGAFINTASSRINIYKLNNAPSQSFSRNIQGTKLTDDKFSVKYGINEAFVNINDSSKAYYVIELETDFDKSAKKVQITNYIKDNYYGMGTMAQTKIEEIKNLAHGNISNPIVTIINNKKPDIEFKKIDGKDKNVNLKDAEFTLFKAETKDGSPVINNGNLSFKEFQREVDNKGEKTNKTYVVTSGEDGKFKFEALEDGIYAVKETKAPKDYAMLLDYALIFKVEGGKIYEVNKAGNYVDKKKIEVNDKAKANLLVDIETGKAEVKPIEIENFKAEYPATGGVGAFPFVFIGMMIMMAGAYMFIRRRDALYE